MPHFESSVMERPTPVVPLSELCLRKAGIPLLKTHAAALLRKMSPHSGTEAREHAE